MWSASHEIAYRHGFRGSTRHRGRDCWVAEAIRRVEADANRSCDTHLHVFPLPPRWGVNLYLKDESVHPTGSLKHRLARSLFLYGLANGWIGPATTVVEASSGSTAVSEAYFARLARSAVHRGDARLDLAGEDRADRVLRRQVSPGGRPRHHLRRSPTGWPPRRAATSWTSSPTPSGPPTGAATTTSPSRIFARCRWSPTRSPPGSWSAPAPAAPPPRSAATSATAATPPAWPWSTRRAPPSTRRWCSGDASVTAPGSRIEGIGRPRVEPSFQPTVIDRMIPVPDARSIAAMHWVREVTGRDVGGSTGTNVAALRGPDPKEMRRGGRAGQHRHPDLRRRRAVPGHLRRRRLAGRPGPGHRTPPGDLRAFLPAS